MVTEQDIVDIVSGEISDRKIMAKKSPSYKTGFFTKDKWIKSYTTLETKKRLVTEIEIKKLIAEGSKTLKISKDTILTPFALEIIQEKGIKIISEGSE
ncbi:MAG: hypothetical protein AB1349_02275 [Elusimicrobiota bacterium]